MLLGLTLVLFGVAIVGSARIAWPVGALMGLSGPGFIAKGWVLGTVGFAPIGALPSNIAQFALGVGILWLLITAWRMKGIIQAVPA